MYDQHGEPIFQNGTPGNFYLTGIFFVLYYWHMLITGSKV